jgi:hypothetical protein
MKKIMITLGSVLLCLFAVAQSESSGRIFKPFKVDVSAGFALPLGGEGTKVGGLFAVEPKYAITDKFALGLRMELASMARVLTTNTGNEITGEGQGNGSFLLTGDYLFNTNNFRPFIGVGAGYYSLASVDLESDYTNQTIPSASKFGFMIRGGFETKHFRFGIEYNGVGSTDFSENNNYIGFKIGGFFGGGRIKK